MSIDIRRPYSDDEVTGVKADFLEYEFEKGGVDIITCYQVLEYIDDNYVDAFAKKLLRNSHIAIVSVPYMWPAGQCKWHKQDPVDVEKLISWFGTSPVFLYKVTEPEGQLARLIAIFVEGTDSEINRDFWRLDAITTSTALRSQYRERTKQSLFGKLKRFTGRVHLRHRE